MSVLKRNMLWGGAVFILILSAISFVFIPAMGNLPGSGAPVFGKWDGRPIEYVADSFFIRQIQAISKDMQDQGQEVNQFSNFQIMQQAFNSTAVRYFMLDELKNAGYKTPMAQINKILVQYYQDETGKYSSKVFNDTPESARSETRAIVTEELTVQRYVDDMFGTQSGLYGLKTSSKETELIKTMAQKERSFTYTSFDSAKYPESEVVKYGTANPDLFVKHDLSIITVDSEATAKKVLSSLSKNEITFEDAVTTYSTRNGADAAGKLTASYRTDLNSLFADAKDLETILALSPNAISSIVKTGESTFAIVRCNAAPQAPVFTDASVIAAVSSYMNGNERGKIEDYFMAQGKEFSAVAQAKGFDAACKDFGVEAKTTTPFGINYGNSTVLTPLPLETSPELSSAVKSEIFFKTAFSLKTTDISEPVLLGTNVVVFKVAEEKVKEIQTLEMVPLYYNYYTISWAQASLNEAVLASDKMEDNFMTTYLQNFLN